MAAVEAFIEDDNVCLTYDIGKPREYKAINTRCPITGFCTQEYVPVERTIQELLLEESELVDLHDLFPSC
jgi:hypothetical protein